MAALRRLYTFHFADERRERFFLASSAFLLTFVIVRTITLMIRVGVGPFHNVVSGATHIHHLVWGILVLLLVGYVWLAEIGVGSSWTASLTAILYGVGAALTLDEFALWLDLRDVYWQSAGRASIDAVLIFAALLSVGWWGGPFFAGIARHVWHQATVARGAS